MKKTCFLAMLAAALMGGQVFAAVVPTTIEGGDQEGIYYYGKHTSDSSDATGGDVTIKENPNGSDHNRTYVYGGYAEGFIDCGAATSNKVSMHSGMVGYIYGGKSESSSASSNTVVVTGGQCYSVYGGTSEMDGGAAENNVVILTGGTVTTQIIVGESDIARNNSLHLVGKGVTSVGIADGQGQICAYSHTGDGNGLKLNTVKAAKSDKQNCTGNSVNIYGTGIELSGAMSNMQILTFNITNTQAAGQSPETALTLNSEYAWACLQLEGVELQVNDLDVQEWTPGTSITLVQSAQAIQGLEDGKAVDIMKDGQAVARGQLVLSNDDKTLSLNVQGSVPEPATGTLGVFALAALAARRRKK